MADIGKEIGTALLGLGQGVNNYVSVQDKMLEHEQRAQKLKKERDLEDFTKKAVEADQAVYMMDSAVGSGQDMDLSPLIQKVEGFHALVPNGRNFVAGRSSGGKAYISFTDDTGVTQEIPFDPKKLRQSIHRQASMTLGKNLGDEADKWENRFLLDRQRQDNRMDILQARLDNRQEKDNTPKEVKLFEYLVRDRKMPEAEAQKIAFGEVAGQKDYSDKQHREVYSSLLHAYEKQGFDPEEAHQRALAGADNYISSRQTKPGSPQPGAAPQVIQAPAPAPAAAPPAGPGGAVGAAAGARAPVANAAPPQAEQPPVPGARKAKDGNWYVGDPKTGYKRVEVR